MGIRISEQDMVARWHGAGPPQQGTQLPNEPGRYLGAMGVSEPRRESNQPRLAAAVCLKLTFE
jgi:hypothetical protein